MSVKLLTEHHLEFASLQEGCIGSSESTLVKIPYCWKSPVAAHMFWLGNSQMDFIVQSIWWFAAHETLVHIACAVRHYLQLAVQLSRNAGRLLLRLDLFGSCKQ